MSANHMSANQENRHESRHEGQLEQATLTKSELIAQIASGQPQLHETDVELAVSSILERMAAALGNGERIEIRGFGSMTLHYRPPRVGRNPKTGKKVDVPEKYVPHFKPGADLRKRVNSEKAALLKRT